MNIYGFESIAGLLDNTGYLFKLIANERGAVLFPHTTEHRDGAQPGIVYADDSRGNALAAMVKPNLIEFRQHRDFSDQRVLNIVGRILELQESIRRAQAECCDPNYESFTTPCRSLLSYLSARLFPPTSCSSSYNPI